MKRKNLLWLIAPVFGLLFVWYYSSGTPKGQAPLRYLTQKNGDQFMREFDAAVQESRLVLLLSPT